MDADRKLVSIALIFFGIFLAGCRYEVPPGESDDARSVLVLANDTSPAEPETKGIGASIFVAEAYAAARNIPPENILRVDCSNEETMSWQEFEERIRAPLRAKLEQPEFQHIRYVVPVYGIPYRLRELPAPPPQNFTQSGFSLDQFIASLFSGKTRHWIENPYAAFSVAQERPRFRVFAQHAPWRMLLVTRIDGSSARAARELIDRTLRAERELRPLDGIGYFDFRNLGTECGDYCEGDLTMRRAHTECVRNNLRCDLNDQRASGKMYETANDALWAWGWYSPNKISGQYRFLPGAVGAQLTSYSANTLRTPSAGGWVHHWLSMGITATWGATAEPYVHGYARGDVLLANFWRGYNFGESAYISLPQLNWMMVFIGDPLYSPTAFRSHDTTPPRISNLRLEERGGSTLVRWRTDERADSMLRFTEGEKTVVAYDSGFTTEHFLSLPKGVSAEVISTDHWGNSSSSTIRSADGL